MKCSRCGGAGTIFDARTDGYDGLLNGGCAYESGADGEAFAVGTSEVTVTVSYNVSFSELEESASLTRSGAKPTDLFDSLAITATPVGGGPSSEFSYECA
jgi:hypothetical protein